MALDVLPHNKSLGALVLFSEATSLAKVDTCGTITNDTEEKQDSNAPMKYATPAFALMCALKDVVLVPTYLRHELLLQPTVVSDINTSTLAGDWANAIKILAESLVRRRELVQDKDLLDAERNGWMLPVTLASVISWSQQAASFSRMARDAFMKKWMVFLGSVTEK
eukprot:331964-Pyramimonas_sp.AAC.1